MFSQAFFGHSELHDSRPWITVGDLLTCGGCGRAVTVTAAMRDDMQRRRVPMRHIEDAPSRFKCKACGARKATLRTREQVAREALAAARRIEEPESDWPDT